MNLFKRKPKITGESIMQVPEGSVVELVIFGGNPENIFFSNLEQVLSNEEILILPPRKDGAEVNLADKSKYEISIKTDKGIFKNVAEVAEKVIEGNMKFYRLKFLEPTKKIQRRESYRLEKRIDFTFSPVEKSEESVLREEIELNCQGLIVDISTGGIKFYTNEDLEEGLHIKMLADVDGMILVAISTILHKEELEYLNKYNYSYKCKFDTIPKRYTELLSKYIFETQRELSKTGKI